MLCGCVVFNWISKITSNGHGLSTDELSVSEWRSRFNRSGAPSPSERRSLSTRCYDLATPGREIILEPSANSRLYTLEIIDQIIN
jgi:hypothetical protein